MIRLDDQVAIVTGSGRGLGLAYARLLADRGARVVVHDAGVSKDGTGSDPNVAANAVRDIQELGGTAVPSIEILDSREHCKSLVETAIAEFGRLDMRCPTSRWRRTLAPQAAPAPLTPLNSVVKKGKTRYKKRTKKAAWSPS
jgi:hypothetical protein